MNQLNNIFLFFFVLAIVFGAFQIDKCNRSESIDEQISNSITDEIRERILAGESVRIVIEINPLGRKRDISCIRHSIDGLMEIYSIVIHHIKYSEGLRLDPYIEPNGRRNIGYGHYMKPGEVYSDLSEDFFTRLLLKDYTSKLDSVEYHFGNLLNRHQRMAVACLAYRMGWTKFRGTPLCYDIENGDYASAVDRWPAYSKWKTPDGKWHSNKGTKLRAKFEASLFDGNWDYICDIYSRMHLDLIIKIQKQIQ